MNDIIVILKQVIAKHPEAMNDQDIIKPLLRKAFFHDKLSGNVLGLIFESGIVDIALLLGNIPAQRLKFYVDSFVNEFGMRPYIAKKYVIIWLQALDIEYEEYEDEEDEYEYIWISGNEKTDESDDEEEYDEDEESDGADEEYDEDDESDNVEEEYDEDDESDDVDEEYDDDEESDDVEEECDEDDESDDVDEEYDDDDESDNVEEEYDEDDESDDVEEEYDEDDESDNVEEEYDEDEENDDVDEEYDEDDESDDVEEEYDEDGENDDVDEEYYEDESEDMDDVEEDMCTYDINPNDDFNVKTYAPYPLLGNRLLQPSTINSLHDEAKKHANKFLEVGIREIPLEAQERLTIAIIDIAKNWDYNYESKFWKYIAGKLGHEEEYKKLSSFLTNCIKNALQSNNRLFISNEVQNFYKATIMAHALTPKSGWLRLCDFLFERYRRDMGFEYESNAVIVNTLVNFMNKQLKSNDAKNIDALCFESESYFFGEGLRKLFILRPKFMRTIIDYMLKRMHELLQGEKPIHMQYIDYIIDEWYNNLKSGKYYDIEDNTKNSEAKRYFTPKYTLENKTDVIIRCDKTLLPQKDVENIELEIYINENFIVSQSLIAYDSHDGKILSALTINVDDCLEFIDDILSLRLIVSADTGQIFDSKDKLYRTILCFKGDREIRPEDLRQGNYLFFVVNGHNLEFENTADETDIDLPNASKWEKAVYVELDADFKVRLDDELIAYDDPNKTINNNFDIKKNLDNLADTIEADVKNLAEIPIRDARGEKWPPKRYMWMGDIDRREIITVSYPTNNPCELWVGDKKVAQRKGKYFALGETVAKFSPRSENSWVDITLRRGGETYPIGHLTKKERFIKSVVMNYEIGKNVLYWNMGGGFVGDNKSEFRLIIYNKKTSVYDEPLDLTSEIAIPNVNIPRGYYHYKIVKQSDNYFDDTDILLCDGEITVGNEDVFRFEGKRLKINKIIHYFSGKIKSEPDSINDVYIDNLVFLDRKYIESEKNNCPIYEGIMFYMDENGRRDFSYAEYSKTENGKTKFFYKVNRVKITFIKKNKLIVCTADGEKLQYHRKLNRKEMKNYYSVVDARTVSYPKNGDYGYIAYFLCSVEEEKQC